MSQISNQPVPSFRLSVTVCMYNDSFETKIEYNIN